MTYWILGILFFICLAGFFYQKLTLPLSEILDLEDEHAAESI